MKKLLRSVVVIITFCLGAHANTGVQNIIGVVYIPDANFKAELVNNAVINTNGDSEIQFSEAMAYNGKILVANKNISDLTGIEAFMNIYWLDCHGNSLTNLNVITLSKLRELHCYDNAITSLNLANNPVLTRLNCANNQLTGLNLSNKQSLKSVYCGTNKLSSLTIAASPNIQVLDCSVNELTMLDVFGIPGLIDLYCDNNQLETLNLSNNSNLKKLHCGANELTYLNVYVTPALINLHCDNNQIETLNLTNNSNLKTLHCDNNLMTAIDVSANLKLTELLCHNNYSLAAIDVSVNTDLLKFQCSNTAVTSLDLSNNAKLELVYADNTAKLTSLNVANGANHLIVGGGTHFNISNAPKLTCVQVDDASYSSTNWTNKDAQTSYSTNCSSLSVNDLDFANTLVIYPNPTQSDLFFKSETDIEQVTVLSLTGVQIAEYIIDDNKIDVSNLPQGVYVLSISTDTDNIIRRFVKQ